MEDVLREPGLQEVMRKAELDTAGRRLALA
jgi:hypothetical protein